MAGATAIKKIQIEAAGYEFRKDDERGWAAFDAADGSEVPGSRSRWLGESVWLAAVALGEDGMPPDYLR